jgi:CheY-like chemotaxis protein
LKDSQGVPEGTVIDAAKTIAHRVNNALSIVLTNSQLAIRQMTNLPEETRGKLQSYLQEVAAAAVESGAVRHQFQEFLDSVAGERSQKTDSAYTDFISFVENIRTNGIHSVNRKSGGRQIPSSPTPLILDASLKGKNILAEPERVRQISILIVDDEDKIRHALSYALTLGGHHVITASDGEEALTLFENGSYDIVFVDLKMPGMDGWAVARSVKQSEPNTKVVLMTGLRVELSDEKLKERHIDAVITKPFELSEIGELIAVVVAEEL